MSKKEKNDENKKMNESQKKIKLLSIDGGGIRGIIPLVILSEIEKRTGKHISELFDYIAGTSTGGIIAMALTVPATNLRTEPRFTAGRILQVYEEEGRKIFGEKALFKQLLKEKNLPVLKEKNISSFLDFLSKVFNPPYSKEGINEITKKIFGDEKFEDLLKTTIITAYETDTRTAQVFNSKDCNYQHLNLADLAKATSAAPLFFEAHEMNKSSYVDGGMFANNPLLCAYIEILKDLKCGRIKHLNGREDKQIYIPPTECLGRTSAKEKTKESWFCFNMLHENLVAVSLGTGGNYKPYLYKDIKKWGVVSWGLNFFDIITDGINDTVQYQMQKMLGENYYRLQLTLEDKYTNMDDACEKNIKSLVSLAKHYINVNDRLIDKLCKILLDDYDNC